MQVGIIFMRIFDYSFLKSGSVPARFVNLVSSIYALRERSRKEMKDHPGIFSALAKEARFQSIEASNAIEGIFAESSVIRMISSGFAEASSDAEKQIAGYKDAFDMVDSRERDLDFRREDMLLLHKAMLSPAGKEYAGKYKQADNLIIEEDLFGNRKIRFVPSSARETPKAMEQLELAYISARSEYGINEILLIPCAILDFLCIHPFSDGNGRMSRLLSSLLLHQQGFDADRYISLDAKIEKNKAEYYESLRLSSIGWEKNENDYFPFAEDFLSSLLQCYKELEDRLSLAGDGKSSKSKRIEGLVLSRIVPISKAEICRYLPDVSFTTVEAVLGRLVKEGKIRKAGSGRGTRYIAK